MLSMVWRDLYNKRPLEKWKTDAADTAEQLITGEYLRKFSQKIQKGSNGILKGLGDTDS
jgi:hypothetical protein